MSNAHLHSQDLEHRLKEETDPAMRLDLLRSFQGLPTPETAVLTAFVDAFVETPLEVQEELARVLLPWGRKAALAILGALRNTSPEQIDQRRLLIRLLGRFAAEADAAQTLLRHLLTDQHEALDAQAALDRIRNDWGNLAQVLTGWGLEVLLLLLCVATPALGIVLAHRPADQPFPWLPTCLGVLGSVTAMLVARFAFDMFDPRMSDDQAHRHKRLRNTVVLGVVGLGLGVLVGGMAIAGKTAAEQVIPKPRNSN